MTFWDFLDRHFGFWFCIFVIIISGLWASIPAGIIHAWRRPPRRGDE